MGRGHGAFDQGRQAAGILFDRWSRWNGTVVMRVRNECLDDGHAAEFDQELQFRSHEQILADLTTAGLTQVSTYQNWSGEAFTGGRDQPLMVVVARKAIDTPA